jgi:transcriptional regulator with XRE-family HTH domain
MSIRALATKVPVTAGHMSRVLRSADGKRPTPTLLRRISEILDLPSDFFIEVRRACVQELVAADDGLTDRLYEQLDRAATARER